MKNITIDTPLQNGDTIYPYSPELKTYLEHADYRITTLGKSSPCHLLIHGINRKIATEEAFFNGITEFIFATDEEDIELVRL